MKRIGVNILFYIVLGFCGNPVVGSTGTHLGDRVAPENRIRQRLPPSELNGDSGIGERCGDWQLFSSTA